MVSLSPSTIRTVRISPGEPPRVTMTKCPSSMKSSDSTSSSRKSKWFHRWFFYKRILLLCLVTFEMLNFSFLLITFVVKSTWNVSSSGNEKVTVVLKLTAIFLFAQPRPKCHVILLSFCILRITCSFELFIDILLSALLPGGGEVLNFFRDGHGCAKRGNYFFWIGK